MKEGYVSSIAQLEATLARLRGDIAQLEEDIREFEVSDTPRLSNSSLVPRMEEAIQVERERLGGKTDLVSISQGNTLTALSLMLNSVKYLINKYLTDRGE